jgi:hypothetical protein
MEPQAAPGVRAAYPAMIGKMPTIVARHTERVSLISLVATGMPVRLGPLGLTDQACCH